MKRPGICIPITDATRDGIIGRAKQFAGMKADLIEWRLDFFAGYEREILSLAQELKRAAGDKKLIVTLRTVHEGGEEAGSRFDYKKVLTALAESGVPDYVDVEIRRDRECVEAVVSAAGKSVTKVIGSYHDFHGTPSEEEMLRILEEARVLGADVGKIACMPSGEPVQGKEDVSRLLAATEKMKEKAPDFPLITMSMGKYGRDSRCYGGLYGSSVSFACVGTASAPGQLELEELNEIFDKIYAGRKHISLIGFMGVGKSTISRELHRLTGRQEIDTDARIVENEGCPISSIFEQKGEAYFRQLETDLIDELGMLQPGIISCGGGMALKDLNVKKLRAMGEIVLLTATPETIFERVKDSTNRPLLNGNMNIPYIKELMDKRRPFYETAATIRVATDGKTITEIAKEILEKTFA